MVITVLALRKVVMTTPWVARNLSLNDISMAFYAVF